MDHPTTVESLNWVLIRGLSREKRHWGDFPELLKKAYPQAQIVVIELPGVGTKYQESSPTTIDGFVEKLRREFITFKDDKKWGIISVSLGGMIAMSWVHKHQNDFEKIVTINSSAGNLSKLHERLSPLAIKKILQLFFKNDMEQRERVILELTNNITPITDDLVRRWASYGAEYPLKREVFLKQLYAASKFKVPAAIKIPYLIMLGAKDRLTNPNCSRTLAKHFGLPTCEHPEAGHDLPLEAPEWIIEKIVQWDQKTSGSPGVSS